MVEAAERYEQLPLGQVLESAHNVRKTFDRHRMQDLVESIGAKGIITPLIVRRAGEDQYEIAAGHRRFRAAQEVGLATVPAIIREYDDDTFLEVLTVENLQREDIHPLEEARGYKELLARPAYDVPGVAAKIGKSETYVRQRLVLLRLREELQKDFLEGKFGFSHALQLARLEPVDQKEMIRTLYDRDGNCCSVADLRGQIQGRIYLDLQTATFPVEDPFLVAKAGACTGCKKRSGYEPKLWPELGKEDYCLDRKCFEGKKNAQASRTLAQLRKGKSEALALSGSYKWEGKQKPGVIFRDEYQVVTPDNPCDHAEKGVVVEDERFGREGLRTGAVVRICRDRRCPVHNPKAVRETVRKAPPIDEQIAELEEAMNDELEEARRYAVQLGALEACRQEGIALPLRVMGSMLVQTLVQDAYTNLPRPVQMRICAARGLPEPTWDNDPMIATFPAMLPSDLWQVMAECVIFGELPAAGHSDNDALEEPKRLVDVIGAAPDEEWLEKRSAEIRAKYEEQIAALREKEATPAAEPKKGKGKKAS